MNLCNWIRHAAARLSEAGVESASLEAQMLASHILIKDRSWIIAHPEADINELAAEAVLQRRERREPLAYILGWREFFGRRFSVRPGVLIPRQETETLVETALQLATTGPVLDLGTGSGCIAITIKLERPELKVYASDVSQAALQVASQNAAGFGAAIEFIQSDSFQGLHTRSFEVIVTNPPYIALEEEVMPEVRLHEPSEALFPGSTGLEFYERLARQAAGHLLEVGALAMEVGHTQADRVVNIFTAQSWKIDRVAFDLSGIARVVVARPPAVSRLP